MKQKQADRPNWGRIIEKRYFQEYISDEYFDGYITYLLLDKVKEPLTVTYELERFCIADNGYSWIMLFPTGKPYSLTIMINQKYEVLQWYFDMIQSIGLTNEGVPYMNDMYLDYILIPNGQLITKDVDELESALSEGLITKDDYDKTKLEGEFLRRSIIEGSNEVLKNTEKYVIRLKKYRELIQ
ncbi:DUF402 domain-containing protein [Paenibacillus sp. KQZ6P-2]|uniref:DUF402 domain-containing protein n=1 Tax=Paenibacillus mangrovi TaxID=2931978 RepID=A0A9X1WU08_9BACL|nr:DUF402 domain-containing protein [Paenibacillus mangrovi]MCJ8013573.1 DUF402 domain-containing protein [Paenibacillus mangrovi]